MSNRTVEAILRLSSKLGSMKAFDQLSTRMDRIDRKAKAYNRTQSAIAANAKDMHAMLLRYAAPAAIAYGAKQAYVEFAELERRMTRIGITADASASETREAFEMVQRSAKDFALPIDDAINGLDTLVSSGMNLKEAMAFLPSVLATAQAAGAATEDIANTAQKASSALGITSADMQRAFDIMVAGGKAGQFELKDMAAYIPELSNSFASLGYEGVPGLKTLIATMQTLREDTGSASAAATQAQNIFGKMYSEETEKRFAKFGINLRKALAGAKDPLQEFVRLSKEAVHGDLSKLPLLFADQELRLGMQSLMTSADSYKRFIDAVNNERVDGSVMRDNARLLGDQAAQIERMASSWDKLKMSIGGAASGPVSKAMDYVAESIDYGTAVNAGLEKSGVHGWLARTWWGAWSSRADKDAMASLGSGEQQRMMAAYQEYSQSRRAGAAEAADSVPVPTPRPDPRSLERRAPPRSYVARASYKVDAPAGSFSPEGGAGFRVAEIASMDKLSREGSDVADAIATALDRSGEALVPQIQAAGGGLGKTAADAIAMQADSIGGRIGAAVGSALAPYIKQAVADLTRPIGSLGNRPSGQLASGNRGASMPTAGLPGGGPR